MNSDPCAAPHSNQANRWQPSYLVLCAVIAAYAAGLMVYSQTRAFAYDEGFHLLAAQLIKNGKRPYIDFFFPQTALNAYWNATWMRLFGDTWRTAHAVAALLVAGAVYLTADYVFVRFPVARWRLPAALSSTVFVALNVAVVEFGPIGQGYALCLVLIVAAFRTAVVSIYRKGILLPAITGFLAAAAAGSSLLSAPAAPVLLLWMVIRNQAGPRWLKAGAFVGGGIVATLPLLRLFMIAPHQTIFDVFKFHLLYRQVEWSGAFTHDIFEVLLAWTTSSSALLLGLLAVAGFFFVRSEGNQEHLGSASVWTPDLRSEWYLCGWLALAIALHLSNAHPTFSRYYLLAVPFLGILATAGFYAVAERAYLPGPPWVPVLALALVFSLAEVKALHDGKDDRTWKDLEKVAGIVERVTPRSATLLSDEFVYFLTRRTPPSGAELEDSHKLELAPAEASVLHVIPKPELERRIKAGLFATFESCSDEDQVAKLSLPSLYEKQEKVDDCFIFWDLKRDAPNTKTTAEQ